MDCVPALCSASPKGRSSAGAGKAVQEQAACAAAGHKERRLEVSHVDPSLTCWYNTILTFNTQKCNSLFPGNRG